MSQITNKTILVPINDSNSLTSFESKHDDYSSFDNNPMMRSYFKGNLFNNYDNPLLALALNIFKQVDILQNSYNVGSLEEIRNLFIDDINYFTETATKKNIDSSHVMLTRYILCTFSDELIGTTYWGADNNWANRSLLSHFYNETSGGEKFFKILDQLLIAPAKYIDLLEVIFVCLSLGFQGKYKIQNNGKNELDAIRESLYKQMKMMQMRTSQTFYTAQNVSTERNHLVYRASYKILGVSIVLLLMLTYGILTFTLAEKEDKTQDILKQKYSKYINTDLTTPPPTYADISVQKRGSETVIIKDINE